MNDAFKEIQVLLAANYSMRYLNHNFGFQMYTDASDYQMGAYIMQQGNPVAY